MEGCWRSARGSVTRTASQESVSGCGVDPSLSGGEQSAETEGRSGSEKSMLCTTVLKRTSIPRASRSANAWYPRGSRAWSPGYSKGSSWSQCRRETQSRSVAHAYSRLARCQCHNRTESSSRSPKASRVRSNLSSSRPRLRSVVSPNDDEEEDDDACNARYPARSSMLFHNSNTL